MIFCVPIIVQHLQEGNPNLGEKSIITNYSTMGLVDFSEVVVAHPFVAGTENKDDNLLKSCSELLMKSGEWVLVSVDIWKVVEILAKCKGGIYSFDTIQNERKQTEN